MVMFRRHLVASLVALLVAGGAAYAEAGPKLYVTNSAGDNIHVIDLRTFKVVGEIKTPDHPHGVAASGDGRRLFITVESDHTLRIIDTATDRVVRVVKLS